MPVCFWYLVKKLLVQCTQKRKLDNGHVSLQGTRQTRPRVTGHPVGTEFLRTLLDITRKLYEIHQI